MKPRVLVVDDEPVVRNFISTALGMQGFDVLTAASARDATEIFERERGGIQLLLTELELPDASGADMAGRLSAKNRHMRVIYTTGQCPPPTRDAVLYKPFTVDRLRQMVGSQCCFHPKAA